MSGTTPGAPLEYGQRRGSEFWLCLLALLISVAGYAAMSVGVNGRVGTDIATFSGWLAGLTLVAHVAVRRLAPHADPVILPIALFLNGLGLVMIQRLHLGPRGTAEHYFPQGYTLQLMWMSVGVVLFVAALWVIRDHRMLQRFTYTFGLAAVVLLLLPAMPVIGRTVNGAPVWIHIGPLTAQPGEVAKVLLVIAFSGYLVVHRDALALAGRRVLGIDLPRGRDLGPILAMWLIAVAVLVWESDLGMSLLFFGVFVILLYVSTERRGWIVVGGALFVVGLAAAYTAVGHVRVRFEIWLHPWQYFHAASGPQSDQLVSSLYGMAWGGLLGRGYGNGMPRLTSFANSDFVIGSIGEELGLTTLFVILVCYALIVARGLRTAIICRDDFGKLLAVGLSTSIAIQVFVIVGGVTRLIPLTGLTTPFLAYGGSSLVVNWVIIALLLRISDQARRPAPTFSIDSSMEETQVVKLG
ncbi:cell division protein FtsW [Nocardioides baekrokdamisoli]|uniref:Cell division protein FtsW n=1 Tax=Nocardioides baekrokdamisoli TaxID=1804624 RepID=A0A3G9IGF7_9ACTN|nr:FtsW/RodA/SpoVE family cell cycle protein [Nocardioides baekrokdamisoli]BBH17352.1 cell division protein FtsW [Nocardioides baekrokdamisoli]